MFTKKIMAVATVTVATMGLGAGVASADTINGLNGPGGTGWHALVEQTGAFTGDRITGSASGAILDTSIGDITCDSEFVSTVTDNPGSDDALIQVNPANSNRSPVDKLEFTGCTDSIPFIVVNSATISGSITGVADAENQTVTLNGITVNVNTSVGTCTYSGNVVGDLDTGAQTLTFVNDVVGKTAGSGLCPSTGAFNAEYELEAWNHPVTVKYDTGRLIN